MAAVQVSDGIAKPLEEDDEILQLLDLVKSDSVSPTKILQRLESIVVQQRPGQQLDLPKAQHLWLLIGSACTRQEILDDSAIELLFNVIETARLFDCIGPILTGIRSADLAADVKRSRMERLIKSVCFVTRLIFVAAPSNKSQFGGDFIRKLSDFTQTVDGLPIGQDVVNVVSRTRQLLEPDESESAQSSVQCEPPNDIVSISVVPTYEAVVDESPAYLRPNIINGIYPDLETYLDIHFRLLLEDFMSPLRQGFAQLRDGRSQRNTSLRVYEKVRFVSSLVNLRNIIPERPSSWKCFWIRFRPLPNVHWAASKRLIDGSLVCLCDPSWQGPDGFIVATVMMSRPKHLARGRLVVAVATETLPQDFLRREYVMMESVVFYEPYRAVLEALQSFDYDHFPFLAYILGCETKPHPPDYLQRCQSYFIKTASGDTDEVYDVTSSSSWPSARRLGLDVRQREALIHALTSRLSLIQGLPGTGKTYLGLRIVEALLANKHTWRDANSLRGDPRSPIVVICYTNHALDQFLEGIPGD